VAEAYVHRIGRTARAGASGVAISFCDGSERGQLKAIERLTRQPLRVETDHPDYPDRPEAEIRLPEASNARQAKPVRSQGNRGKQASGARTAHSQSAGDRRSKRRRFQLGQRG
jgi:ATP-dependent RNA helicase RhlE